MITLYIYRRMTMIKLAISFLWVLTVLALATGGALAASSSGNPDPGIVTGTYHGTIFGDRESQAEIELNLTQKGDEIVGDLILDEGLFIDAGRCWSGYLPAGAFSTGGSPLVDDSHRFEAIYTYEFSGIPITGYLTGAISPDGDELSAEVEIDIPWFCGSDPVLQVSAERQP
jgi:hypothetical protein